MNKRKRLYSVNVAASAAVIAAGSMWGSVGMWVRKYTDTGLDSMQILALRVSVTAITMLLFLTLYNRALLKINWKDLWCFGGTGICSIIFFGYCYNRTIIEASLSVAAILLYTSPIFVMILSRILFGELWSARKITALLMAFAATLVLADWPPVLEFVAESPGNFFYGIGCGVIATTVPYILYTFGLSNIDNSRASIMATVEPIVATLLGYFLFQEKLTLTNGIGIALVLGAIVVLAKEKT